MCAVTTVFAHHKICSVTVRRICRNERRVDIFFAVKAYVCRSYICYIYSVIRKYTFAAFESPPGVRVCSPCSGERSAVARFVAVPISVGITHKGNIFLIGDYRTRRNISVLAAGYAEILSQHTYSYGCAIRRIKLIYILCVAAVCRIDPAVVKYAARMHKGRREILLFFVIVKGIYVISRREHLIAGIFRVSVVCFLKRKEYRRLSAVVYVAYGYVKARRVARSYSERKAVGNISAYISHKRISVKYHIRKLFGAADIVHRKHISRIICILRVCRRNRAYYIVISVAVYISCGKRRCRSRRAEVAVAYPHLHTHVKIMRSFAPAVGGFPAFACASVGIEIPNAAVRRLIKAVFVAAVFAEASCRRCGHYLVVSVAVYVGADNGYTVYEFIGIFIKIRLAAVTVIKYGYRHKVIPGIGSRHAQKHARSAVIALYCDYYGNLVFSAVAVKISLMCCKSLECGCIVRKCRTVNRNFP